MDPLEIESVKTETNDLKCELMDIEPISENVMQNTVLVEEIKSEEPYYNEEEEEEQTEGTNESDEDCQSSSVQDTDDSLKNRLITLKSQKKYDQVYKEFMNWRNENTLSEESLLAYFKELSATKKPPSLWAYYSMLKTTLLQRDQFDIRNYNKLKSFLKSQSHGYKPKKSKALTSQEIHRFLSEAPDEQYLLIKVALILGISGGCSREELWKLKLKNVQDIGESTFLIYFNDRKGKCSRTFTVDGQFYKIIKKYINLQPTRDGDERFFMEYRGGKLRKYFVGINQFGTMAKKVAKYLNLPNPEDYNAHCFKMSSISSAALEDLKKRDLSSRIMPIVSQKKYDQVYNELLKWLKAIKVNSFSENAILTYFEELAKTRKCSTLWVHYSMLKTTLLKKQNIDLNGYERLKHFLKNQSMGYQPKKTKTLTAQQIHKFLSEAPDEKYLLAKVALIIGIRGGCNRNELWNLKIENVKDLKTAYLITIPDKKHSRTFTITGKFYEKCKKYINLRSMLLKQKGRFFLHYMLGKCTLQVAGINRIGSIPKQVAQYLNLPNPETYTGHGFRRSSPDVLVDAPKKPETQSIDSEDNAESGRPPSPEFFAIDQNEMFSFLSEI